MNEKKAIDLTVDELRFLIHDAVGDALVEFFGDLDEELKVRPGFLRELERRRDRFIVECDAVTLDEAFTTAADD